MATISPLSYVYDGRQCLGFILRRGKLGFEAIDREEASLGIFKTSTAAASAVFDAATSNKKIPGHEGPGKLKGSDSGECSSAPSSAQHEF